MKSDLTNQVVFSQVVVVKILAAHKTDPVRSSFSLNPPPSRNLASSAHSTSTTPQALVSPGLRKKKEHTAATTSLPVAADWRRPRWQAELPSNGCCLCLSFAGLRRGPWISIGCGGGNAQHEWWRWCAVRASVEAARATLLLLSSPTWSGRGGGTSMSGGDYSVIVVGDVG